MGPLRRELATCAVAPMRPVEWGATDYAVLGLVGLVAAVVRALFYSGMLFSDDLTYVDAALKLLHGDWSAASYVGALRYGMNLPIAFSMWLFGTSEVVANLWPFFCSIAEVGVVYVVSNAWWGRRAALLSALLLTFMPLHVHYAGRLMADAPLALFITLTFVIFWFAERRRSVRLYIGAGLAFGAIFWVKEMVMPLVGLSFLVYVLFVQSWRWVWLWMAASATLVIGANCLLFWYITGDPLYIASVMRAGLEKFSAAGFLPTGSYVETTPLFYVWRLFVDVRHTWLLGYLALGGVLLALSRTARGEHEEGSQFAVAWAVALIGVFSVALGSIDPPRLIWKQSNYLLIFAAPLVLLATYLMSAVPHRVRILVSIVYCLGAALLAGFAQQDVRVFTSNSRAAVDFAQQNDTAFVYGMNGAYRAALAAKMFGTTKQPLPVVSDIASLDTPEVPRKATAGEPHRRFAILDMQTAHWGKNALRSVADVPSCWISRGLLESKPAQGAGSLLLQYFEQSTRIVPGDFGSIVRSKTQGLLRPQPAYVYEIPTACPPLRLPTS